ncbi:MAG: hypothetical protein WCJ51_02820 [Candidatus Moraniibacteriota bacterium]
MLILKVEISKDTKKTKKKKIPKKPREDRKAYIKGNSRITKKNQSLRNNYLCDEVIYENKRAKYRDSF